MTRAARDTASVGDAGELEHLLSLSRDLFVVVKLDGSLERVNAACARVLGWTEDELKEMDFRTLVHPDDVDDAEHVFKRIVAGEDENGFEVRLRTRSGDDRWIDWVATPLLERGLIYALGRDVTTRRAAEEARRVSETRFRTAIEGGFEAFIAYAAEPDGFRIVELNSRAAAILGATKAELVGSRWDKLGFDEGVVHAFSERFRRVCESGEPLEDEYTYLDGSHTMHYQIVPTLEGVALICRDITARRRAEKERARQARALRESEQRFLSVVQNVPGAFFTVVPCEDEPGEMRLDFLSNNVETFTGHAADAFVGPDRITLESMLVEEDRAVLRSAEERAQLKEPYAIDVRLRRADGSLRWIHIKGQPMVDERGEACGTSGVMLDITDRRLAEAKLRESEALLRGVLANIPGVFFRTVRDGDGWRIVYASERARDVLGVEPSALENDLTFASLVHPDDVEVFDSAEARLAAGEPYEIDFRVVVAGGERWVREVAQPELDETGRVVAAIGFLFDATERVAAEDALRLRDRALETLTQGVMIVDATTAGTPIVYVNPAFEQLTGYTAQEVVGRSPSLLNGPDSDPQAVAEIERALANGEPLDTELTEYRKDGSSVWSAVRLSPVHDERGVVTHFISLHSDETRRKVLEEQFLQAQRMDAVGRIAGGVAHDFNNVLLVIRGYSHVLMSMLGQGSEGWEEAREIESAAERASELIRQLLAFSRTQVTQTQLVNPNDVVQHTQALLQPLLGDDVEIETSLDPLLGSVKADPSQLEQALVNLVVNARDAMPAGGTLQIRTRTVVVGADAPAPGLPAGTYCTLAVEDTGSGMDDDTKARMFEPFFSTKGREANGLGLSTVYGLVKQSGGDVVVVTAPGEGTSITLYLPQAREAVLEVAPSALPAPDRLSRGTVLLVEDDDRARALVGRLLREAEYEVHEAAQPDEALRLCEEHEDIDLLLSDVVMPQMSGPTLAKQILERRPELPVLFVSGYIERVDDVDVVSAGAGFLQKPFTPQELISTVRGVLERGPEVAA